MAEPNRTIEDSKEVGVRTIKEDGKVVGRLTRKSDEYCVHFFGGFSYYRRSFSEAKKIALTKPLGVALIKPDAEKPAQLNLPTAKPKTSRKPTLYFAYGANTDINAMATRCPGAIKIGVGTVSGWKLEFRGCADIVPLPDEKVVGAVWLIQPSDEDALDRFEGFPFSYIKKTVTVEPDPSWGEQPVKVMAYVMTGTRRGRQYLPSQGYFNILVRGYKHFGIDRRQIERALANAAADSADAIEEGMVEHGRAS